MHPYHAELMFPDHESHALSRALCATKISHEKSHKKTLRNFKPRLQIMCHTNRVELFALQRSAMKNCTKKNHAIYLSYSYFYSYYKSNFLTSIKFNFRSIVVTYKLSFSLPSSVSGVACV